MAAQLICDGKPRIVLGVIFQHYTAAKATVTVWLNQKTISVTLYTLINTFWHQNMNGNMNVQNEQT